MGFHESHPPGSPRGRPEAATSKPLRESGFAVEAGGGAEFLFNAKQLIVLGDAVGAAGRAGFDLAGGGSDGEVSDERIFSFARTVRNDGFIAGFAGQLDGVNGFGDGADLIELDENRVGDAI